MNTFPPKLPWTELFVRSGLKTLSDRVRQRSMVRRVRGAVDDLRSTVRNAARQRLPQASAAAGWMVQRLLEGAAVGPSAIVNATGIIAPRGYSLPLAEAAIASMHAASEGFSTATSALEPLLIDLTGAEAALVLHSPSAACLAVLSALGGPVVVARSHVGEADDVALCNLAALAGTRLTEIGSVGRVSCVDYRAALKAGDPACVWHSQPQSIAVLGEMAAPSAEEVFAIAREHGCPAIEYLEAATLVELSTGGNSVSIPIARASLLAGADLVVLPGDRFIGGPSCGIIVGRSKLVARVAAHVLARSSALDSGRLAALVATLELMGDRARLTSIPTYQLLCATSENLQHRADRLVAQLSDCSLVTAAEAVPCPGFLNDGRLKTQQFAGWGVAITATEPSEMFAKKRLESPPRVAVLQEDGRLIFNLRSVLAGQDAQLAAVFQGKSD